MIRRFAALAAPVLGVVLVSTSCSTFDPPAAQVGDQEISQDLLMEGVNGFENLLPETAEALEIQIVPGTAVRGDTARFWLAYLIRRHIADATLATLGGAITPEDTQAGQDLINSDPSAADLPTAVQTEIINTVAANRAINRSATVPAPAELEARYAAQPASTGALCLRHLVVPTLREANQALAEINAGADFAEVAARVSTEEAAVQTGGALTSGELPCIALPDMVGSFDPDFMLGALQAKPGVPTAPVRSSFGWHVILARPWTEISEGLIETVAINPGQAALYAGYTTTPVAVSAKFGRWNPGAANVGPNP